ncbi:DeoR/GlpR family DNA-binding transcription regulator (plasmid) [Alkalihalophilus pseudofirmus]|uniref:DeoR/GlpR family DNA-binding transcription regulator n=1 Tax=Alkalihalophilus pseudofirmus TaxID=79885 RepID=UPI00259B9546|nr:DeoR/GlpR family DNA-binding transcription regulator [Alkalihalophilus pseudofirmus]WEG19225.1 DeoR/GlpR family DNA-binding transcription regulator [Alkalihalophilus pseudofirmus]
MLSIERNEVILKILKRKKTVSSQYLCKELYCSLATLRRSLIELEKNGLVKRFHGGVSIVPDTNIEYPHIFREVENQNEKSYACNLALDFIADGYAIFLDSSSTVSHICPSLKKFKDITVVTNGLKTALDLREYDSITTFIAGGQLKENSTSIVGELTGQFIKNFKANLSIISCRGIDEQGIYEANHMQALVKQHMIKNSQSTILLCDSSKFNRSHFYKLDSFTNIDAVITDTAPSKELMNAILSSECEVLF